MVVVVSVKIKLKHMDDKLKKDVTDEEEDQYLDELSVDSQDIDGDGVVDHRETNQKEHDEASNSDGESLGSVDETIVENSVKPAEEDAVVDEVVREESDRLLKSDDDALKRQFEPPKENKTIKSQLKKAVRWWWDHKLLRNATFLAIFLSVAASVLLPSPRYFLLNAAGIRVRSSMTIVDSQTGLPLKNIPVNIQGQEKRSGDDGSVSFENLKVGSSTLNVEKLGYAKFEKKLVLGLGSNPIGNQQITATGAQYRFVLTDWLSGKPVLGAEASSGEDSAQSDDEGHIVLTVGEVSEDSEAIIRADDYREVTIKLADITEEKPIEMIPAKQHTFVSNRSGKYDLYKIDVDGTNEQVLLAATGQEREIPFVLPHPAKDYAAYISTRDGEVNSGGFVFDGLFIVDVKTGDSKRVVRSEQLQIIGWEGDKLIYTVVGEGVSAGNPERSKIFSYDVETTEKKQLASANYFNDVKLIRGTVFYSVSSFSVPLSAAKLYSIKPDGSNKQTVVDSQVWSIIWASYDVLNFRAVDESFNTRWLTQKVGELTTTTLEAPPIVQTPRQYSVSSDGKRAVWVDQRDGKGVLLRVDIESAQEEAAVTAPGLDEPVYWLNNQAVVYRVTTSEETADYVVNLDGGEPHKIADVIGNRSRDFY